MKYLAVVVLGKFRCNKIRMEWVGLDTPPTRTRIASRKYDGRAMCRCAGGTHPRVGMAKGKQNVLLKFGSTLPRDNQGLPAGRSEWAGLGPDSEGDISSAGLFCELPEMYYFNTSYIYRVRQLCDVKNDDSESKLTGCPQPFLKPRPPANNFLSYAKHHRVLFLCNNSTVAFITKNAFYQGRKYG